MISTELSYSAKSNLLSCPRQYFFSNILRITPVFGTPQKRFGSIWHAFQEGYYSFIKRNGWTQDGYAITQAGIFGQKAWDEQNREFEFNNDTFLTMPLAGELFLEYISEFDDDQYNMEILETEQTFLVEYPLTQSEKSSYEYLSNVAPKYKGKIDLQVSLGHADWIVEFKTTSWSLPGVTKTMERSPQLLGYQVCAEVISPHDIDGALVPILYTSARKKKDGDWGKVSHTIVRVPRIFSDGDKKEWRKSLIWAMNYLEYHKKLGLWPLQWESCNNFGGCDYLDLCLRTTNLKEIDRYIEPDYQERSRLDEDNIIEGTKGE